MTPDNGSVFNLNLGVLNMKFRTVQKELVEIINGFNILLAIFYGFIT